MAHGTLEPDWSRYAHNRPDRGDDWRRQKPGEGAAWARVLMGEVVQDVASRVVRASIPYGYGYGNRPGLRGSFTSDGYGVEHTYPEYKPMSDPLLAPAKTSFGIPGSSVSAEADFVKANRGWELADGYMLLTGRTGRPVGRPRKRNEDPVAARAALEAALHPLTIDEARATPRRGNLSTESLRKLRVVNAAIARTAEVHDHEILAEIIGLSASAVGRVYRRA
jgi:hypothetical protein